MGFRFRRSIKIAPGLRLNLSKSGVSTSIGPRGAKVTLGHGKTRLTAGLPGTGLSHTEVINNEERSTGAAEAIGTFIGAAAAIITVLFLLGLLL